MTAWLRGFWLLMLLALTWPASAQNAVLRGRVLDAETHQPIPNAQVGVAGNRLGTSTNDDGRFVLGIPPAYVHERLTVALLGYRSYAQALPPLPGPELLIELSLSPAALGEVQVTGSVEGIVREAVARIPRNYAMRPTQLTGFYRESDNDTLGRPRYLVEGLLMAYKPGYQQPNDDGDVQIRQVRRVDLRPASQAVRIDWAGGPLIAQYGDFVHRRAQFIDPKQMRYYQYRLGPGSSYAGRPVYVVEFAPRAGSRRADYTGRMYIDQVSYAFLGAEWRFTAGGLARSPNRATARRLRVAYQPYAGRWHLKTVWWQTRARPPIGPVINFFGEFLTTAIDTAGIVRPGYLEKAQENDVFLRTTVAYDSAFWAGQTTLLPSAALRQASLDQARQQRADSLFRAGQPRVASDGSATAPGTPAAPESRLMRLLGRFSGGATAGTWPLAVTAAGLGVDFAPAGSAFRLHGDATTRPQDFVLRTGFAYQLDVSKSLALSVTTQQVYRQFAGNGWQLGLRYQRNLRPQHRPLFARAGLAYCRQTVARDLGTFDNPDDGLRVAGTLLDASRLSARLQTRTAALLPTLGLGLELSHRYQLTAEAGYLLLLRTTAQLELAEESGFYFARRTSALDLPAEGVAVRVDNQLGTALPWQLQPWLVQVGLLYRVR